MTKDRDAMIERAKDYLHELRVDELGYSPLMADFAIEIRDEALEAERERIVAGLETEAGYTELVLLHQAIEIVRGEL